MQSHVWWADNTSDMTCVQITGNDPLRAASWLAATDNRQVSLLVNRLHANSHQSATELLSTFQPIDRKQLSLESSSPATTKNQLPTFHNSVPPQLASTGHWTKFFGRLPPKKEETEEIFASNWRTGSLFILQDPTVFQNAVVKIDAGAQRQPLAKVLFEQTTKWAGLGTRVWLLLLLLLAQFPSMMLSKVPGT